MATENLFTPDCIRTVTGKYVNVFDPKPEMFCIEDVAHSLSFQCRFGSHLPVFFSVAQHSVRVAERSIRLSGSEETAFQALMHDASEAYLMDIPRPIKQRMPEYKKIEEGLMECLSFIFGFPWPVNKITHEADEIELREEWERVFLQKGGIEAWSSDYAKEQFLYTYNDLKPK